MHKFYILCFVIPLLPLLSSAQTEYGLGMNRNDEAYENSPRKATLLTRDYSDIPSSHSLKKYCPAIDNQGEYGTCVGWSSAYAARTILEAYQNGWTDTYTITQNAYSAGFLYYHIKDSYDYNCQGGSFPSDAMESMMRKGVPKHTDYNDDCPSSISSNIYSLAESHKIQDYATLFDPYASNSIKAQSVKKAIANNNPVVIGMMLPQSFMYTGEKWTPEPYDNLNNTIGGHAMCVVGYDDYKYGGAFEIMNSWGTNWGGQGFVWVTYEDFAEYVLYAYEPIAIPAHVPAVDPTYDLSGEIKFMLSTGQEMEAEFEDITDDFGYYRMKDSYPSGTKFRIYITNNQPAFVYAFGSDQTTAKNFTIFPHNSKTSAALNYEVFMLPSRMKIIMFEWIILSEKIISVWFIPNALWISRTLKEGLKANLVIL